MRSALAGRHSALRHGFHGYVITITKKNMRCFCAPIVMAEWKQASAKLRTCLAGARRRCAKKQKTIGIGIAEVYALWDAQRGKCALSGIKFDVAHSAHKNTPSLDQIIPGGGYEPGNVQLVTAQVNISKSTLSLLEFNEMCERVVHYSRMSNSSSSPSSSSDAVELTAAS